MTWFRLPLFIWSHYATSLIMLLGTPVLAITIVLVALERLFWVRHFRSRAGRRSDAVSTSVLVLFPSGGLHHDSPRHGSDQRTRSRPFRANASSATRSSPSPASPSRCWAFSSGATICSSAANRCMPAWCFPFSACWWPSPRRSKFLTGRRLCTKVRSS